MHWLVYALITIVLWTSWSFFGAIALRSVSAAQATLLFGVVTVVAGGLAFVASARDADWSAPGLGVAALSGTCGAAGMITALAVTGVVLVGTGG